MEPDEQALERVLAVAKLAAGEVRAPTTVTRGKNPSTDVDLAVRRLLEERLPGVLAAPVVGEEGTSDQPVNGAYWLVDSIDGTLNVLAGAPEFAISIALVADGRAQLAVVHAPHIGETYGTFRRRGGVRTANRPDAAIRSARVPKFAAIGFSETAHEDPARAGEIVSELLADGFILRQSGSAAIDICRVAVGIWDGFVEEGIHVWDVIAADLIMTETGGSSRTSPGVAPASSAPVTYAAARSPEVLESLWQALHRPRSPRVASNA